MRGAKAWFERMRAYKWDEEPNDPSKPVKRVPIKRDDDTCFPAGTLVTMADGSCRPIETIRAGDRVLGARGGVTVIASGMTSDDAPLVRVAGIVCTPNHLILTDRGWVRADEIVTGDSVYTDADRYNVMHDSAEDDLERLDVPSLPRLEASVTSCLLAASPHRGGAVSASRRVGDGEWSIAGWMGSSPPRRKPAEQRAVEPRSFVVSGRACQAPSRVGDQRPETDRQGDRGVACLARHARRIGLAPRARQTHVDRSRGRTDDVPTLRPVVYDEAGVGEAVEVLLRPVQSGCPAGSAPVYDLTLDDADHLFFANGVAVHNCNADRYMHEAADGFPMVRATKVTRDMLGLPLATEAV